MVFGRNSFRSHPAGGSAFRESQQNRGAIDPDDSVRIVAEPEAPQPQTDEVGIYIPDINYFAMVRSMTDDPEILRAVDKAEASDREMTKAKLPGEMTREEIDASYDYLGRRIIESQHLQRALLAELDRRAQLR